jgi:hypothetical protein
MQERSVLSTFIDHYAVKHPKQYRELIERLEQEQQQAPAPKPVKEHPKPSLVDRMKNFLYDEQPFTDP